LIVNENDQAKFTIKASGKPRPLTKWFKDENEIKLDENFDLIENEEETLFTIKSCKSQENSGVYYVKIYNDFGETFSNKVTLSINSEYH